MRQKKSKDRKQVLVRIDAVDKAVLEQLKELSGPVVIRLALQVLKGGINA